MSTVDRRNAVDRKRSDKLKALRDAGQTRNAASVAKFFRKTKAYTHLTLDQRKQVAAEVATLVGSWPDAVLFGEVADKRVVAGVEEQAYEQVLTRYEAFLARQNATGIVAYDANDTVVERFTALMERFQIVGGAWRRFNHITAHPFFVASHTSDMIQIADVISYGLRRYYENGETDLINAMFNRFDRLGLRLVGLRHARGHTACVCLICSEPR